MMPTGKEIFGLLAVLILLCAANAFGIYMGRYGVPKNPLPFIIFGGFSGMVILFVIRHAH